MMQAVMMPAFAAGLRRGVGSVGVSGEDGVYVIFSERGWASGVEGLDECGDESRARG